MKKQLLKAMLLSMSVISMPLLAEPAETFTTDLLQPEQGFTGKNIGAVVEKIDYLQGGEESFYRVVVTVPESEIESSDIELLGKKAEPLVPVRRISVIDDYHEGKTGIVIWLPKKMPFALRLNAADNDEGENP